MHEASLGSEMNALCYGINLKAVALLLQELQAIKVARFLGKCVALADYGPKTAMARNVLKVTIHNLVHRHRET